MTVYRWQLQFSTGERANLELAVKVSVTPCGPYRFIDLGATTVFGRAFPQGLKGLGFKDMAWVILLLV